MQDDAKWRLLFCQRAQRAAVALIENETSYVEWMLRLSPMRDTRLLKAKAVRGGVKTDLQG